MGSTETFIQMLESATLEPARCCSACHITEQGFLARDEMATGICRSGWSLSSCFGLPSSRTSEAARGPNAACNRGRGRLCHTVSCNCSVVSEVYALARQKGSHHFSNVASTALLRRCPSLFSLLSALFPLLWLLLNSRIALRTCHFELCIRPSNPLPTASTLCGTLPGPAECAKR